MAAHGTAKGLGNFFGGVVHPVTEPAHLLAIVALGLFVGQRGLEKTQPAILWFVGALVIGLAATGVGLTLDTEEAVLGVAGFLGASVAASASWPRWVACGLCAVAGAGIGLASRPDELRGGAMVAMLLGVAVGGAVWVANVVVLVEHLQRPWLRVLVRVVGSWATASCVLVLALWFSQREALPADKVLPFVLRR